MRVLTLNLIHRYLPHRQDVVWRGIRRLWPEQQYSAERFWRRRRIWSEQHPSHLRYVLNFFILLACLRAGVWLGLRRLGNGANPSLTRIFSARNRLWFNCDHGFRSYKHWRWSLWQWWNRNNRGLWIWRYVDSLLWIFLASILAPRCLALLFKRSNISRAPLYTSQILGYLSYSSHGFAQTSFGESFRSLFRCKDG